MFIEIFDQLSYKPYLFVNHGERNKSFISALVGLLVVVSVLVLTIYFLKETLNRKTPLVSYNEREDIYPNIDLSSWPISIGLEIENKLVEDPTIFNITVLFMSYATKLSEENKIINNNEFTELFLEDCDINEFKKLNYSFLNNTLCLNPNKYNLTISGIYGDNFKGYTYLNFFFNRCVNNTNSDLICKSDEYIDNYLKNSGFLKFGFPKMNIDHNNVSNPFNLSMKTVGLAVSDLLFKRHYIKLQQVYYDTDIGFVFEERDVKKSFVFSELIESIDLKKGAFRHPSARAQITLQANPISLNYYRSYYKLQTVIANAGGALNSIYTVGLILMHFFTKKDYFLSLFNKCFIFNQEETKEINKLKDESEVVSQNLRIGKEKINYFDLTFCEKLVPEELCLCNKNVKKYVLLEDLVMEKLSYEGILETIIKFENLTEILFSEEQLANFNSIKKRCVNINSDNRLHHINPDILKKFKNNENNEFINRTIITIPFRNNNNFNQSILYNSNPRLISEMEN